MTDKWTRRAVLARALQLPLGAGALVALTACTEKNSSETLVCATPEDMTSAEASVRRTLAYVEVSPDPAAVCAGCEFFSAGAGACGTCTMFNGAAVNPAGRCDSWSSDA